MEKKHRVFDIRITFIHRYLVMGVVVLILMMVLSACAPYKVVTIPEATAIAGGGVFDPKVYAANRWPGIVSGIVDEGTEISTVLGAIQADSSGVTTKDNLKDVADQYGVTTEGESHVFKVKGKGQVVGADTEARYITVDLTLNDYNGPIKVKLYTGPRIPSAETAVRDISGITFDDSDFKDQTEFGKAGREINKLVLEGLADIDPASLQGQEVSFAGAFSIPTFNKPPAIDVSEVIIVPVQLEVGG
jgi:predicted lipoprotein